MSQSFTVTLPDDLAEMVRARVRSGEYASVDEVIGAALAQGDDTPVHSGEAFEHWLRTEVVETIDRMKADRSRGRTPEQVRTTLEDARRRIMASRS